MKKIFVLAALLCASVAMVSSCSNDNESRNTNESTAATLDYSANNATSWGNYALTVAQLLRQDAKDLYNAWNVSFKGGEAYATTFKNHNSGAFKSSKDAIEQIIAGCIDIATEVGNAKIGEPIGLFKQGKTTEALYAVESWYSWHSRDDYTNNIYSIQSALLNTRDQEVNMASVRSNPSILQFVALKGNTALTIKVFSAVNAAKAAIQAIPQPFRNNLGSSEAVKAQEACIALADILEKELKPYITANTTDADLASYSTIAKNYVDLVVLPTYKDLLDRSETLYQRIATLQKSPSNQAFEDAAAAWLSAREPWEKSEAFLFGPVADLGLDPNMDSWPLDQEGIVNVLNSNKWDALNWTEGQDEKAIETAQNLRGFHTLEYLIFKDGKARTVK